MQTQTTANGQGDDDEKNESLTEFSVTDDLYRISEATHDDGTVDVEIVDFERDGDTVTIHFLTPTNQEKSDEMEWPTTDSREYEFVRLCEQTVGGLTGAEWLKQGGETVRADPETWEIQVTPSIQRSLYTTLIEPFTTLTREDVRWVSTMLLLLGLLSSGIVFMLAPLYGLATALGMASPINNLFVYWCVVTFAGLIILPIIDSIAPNED